MQLSFKQVCITIFQTDPLSVSPTLASTTSIPRGSGELQRRLNLSLSPIGANLGTACPLSSHSEGGSPTLSQPSDPQKALPFRSFSPRVNIWSSTPHLAAARDYVLRKYQRILRGRGEDLQKQTARVTGLRCVLAINFIYFQRRW